MSSINEYLLQLQSLTKTNLDILQAINDSFFTKQERITANIDGSPYIIPSFLTLENKINSLQANFDNLVHAPESGEAYFNFDGDSRAIEVRGYNHVPNRITLNNIGQFSYEQNDIFKDFLTPKPYVNFNLASLPNDITSVNVKKIIPLSTELIDRFKSYLNGSTSSQVDYSEIYKIISIYNEDIDYVSYDTIMKMPIRENVGSATYVIESIVSDTLDVDLDEYVTVKLRTDLDGYAKNLTYKLFNETIEKSLNIGDELVTYDNSAKLIITEVHPNSNTLVLKVAHGEYLNLIDSKDDQEISDGSKLRFFSAVDFDSYKHINIPLEEDRYVFIAVAALNDRMNIQGSWGTGVILDVDSLVNENGIKFREYYDKNVRNVGDVLFEITSMMSNTLTKYSKEMFDKITTAVPELNSNHIQVTHINKHLNDSTTVKNIRALYSQKKLDQTALNEIQGKINDINSKLATISFDDTTNLRATYSAQLSEYNSKKNELLTSITKNIDAISVAANNAEVPIEAAKYRVRGFFEPKAFAKQLGIDSSHICGIRVQYRYKNVEQEQGNAMSIGDKNNGENLFIFSDWNTMQGFDNPKQAQYISNYEFENTPYNGNVNEPSYNQIDIPISQGETVDIRLKVVYDFGRPFVEVTSAWSEIMNIKFPTEFLKDVQVLDIISENNNDIETNRFAKIIEEQGIPTHVNDKIVDQDLTYYHRPESIASGFYTAERRIIPLKDKLSSMDTSLQELKDEVMGTSAEALSVNIVNGEVVNKIYANQDNNILMEAYDALDKTSDLVVDGVYTIDNNHVVSTLLNIVLANPSEHTMKIYSMFPGKRTSTIEELENVRFDKNDYCTSRENSSEDLKNLGVWMLVQGKDSKFKLQTGNQLVTFRIKDNFDNTVYYSSDASFSTDNKMSLNKPKPSEGAEKGSIMGEDNYGMILYPTLREENALCLDSDARKTYLTIAPKSELIIPVMVEYKLQDKQNEQDNTSISSISKTMSFDVRTSLYQDPINYTFTVTAKYTSTTQDKLIYTNRKSYGIKDVNNNGWIKYHSTEIK